MEVACELTPTRIFCFCFVLSTCEQAEAMACYTRFLALSAGLGSVWHGDGDVEGTLSPRLGNDMSATSCTHVPPSARRCSFGKEKNRVEPIRRSVFPVGSRCDFASRFSSPVPHAHRPPSTHAPTRPPSLTHPNVPPAWISGPYVLTVLCAFGEQEKQFSLIDFGSAGGTFVRLATGVPTPLYPSMMIMLGKHQVCAPFFFSAVMTIISFHVALGRILHFFCNN